MGLRETNRSALPASGVLTRQALHRLGFARHVPVTLVLAAIATAAWTWTMSHAEAAPPNSKAPSKAIDATASHSGVERLLIEGNDGAFELGVHPDIITVIYVPEAIQQVLSSDDTHFAVEVMGPRIIIRPRRAAALSGDPGSLASPVQTANINIETSSYKLGLLLQVVEDPRAAATLVLFESRSESELQDERIEREVAQQTESLRAQFEARYELLLNDAESLIRLGIARRLIERNGLAEFDLRERNDENVIAWLKRGLWVGADLYLLLEIQNRSSQPYRLVSIHTYALRPVGGHVRIASFSPGPELSGTWASLWSDSESVEADPQGSVSRGGLLREISSGRGWFRRARPRADRVQFRSPGLEEEGGDVKPLELVPPDEKRQVILCIADAARFSKRPIVLRVATANPKHTIAIRGIQWR